MLKYENVAQIGDTIKTYDFQPMEGRPDCFIEGVVLDKGLVKPAAEYLAYTIKVTADSDEGERVGDIVYVPYEKLFEYDGRVVLVSKGDQQ